MLKEKTKEIMREQFLDIMLYAGNIDPRIAKAEDDLYKEFRRLETTYNFVFKPNELTDMVGEYIGIWEDFIYDIANQLRDCFEKVDALSNPRTETEVA